MTEEKKKEEWKKGEKEKEREKKLCLASLVFKDSVTFRRENEIIISLRTFFYSWDGQAVMLDGWMDEKLPDEQVRYLAGWRHLCFSSSRWFVSFYSKSMEEEKKEKERRRRRRREQ